MTAVSRLATYLAAAHDDPDEWPIGAPKAAEPEVVRLTMGDLRGVMECLAFPCDDPGHFICHQCESIVCCACVHEDGCPHEPLCRECAMQRCRACRADVRDDRGEGV